MKNQALILIAAITLMSCGVSQHGASIEYKRVISTDQRNVYWESLDSTRSGSFVNDETVDFQAGDTLRLKAYYR